MWSEELDIVSIGMASSTKVYLWEWKTSAMLPALFLALWAGPCNLLLASSLIRNKHIEHLALYIGSFFKVPEVMGVALESVGVVLQMVGAAPECFKVPLRISPGQGQLFLLFLRPWSWVRTTTNFWKLDAKNETIGFNSSAFFKLSAF